MDLAFNNTYDPIELAFDKSIPEVDPALEIAWTKLRMYDYYRENKASIDKYGILLPDMKLSAETLKNLRSFVKEKGLERLKELKVDDREKTKFLRKKY